VGRDKQEGTKRKEINIKEIDKRIKTTRKRI
jgi:hypothetical protein